MGSRRGVPVSHSGNVVTALLQAGMAGVFMYSGLRKAVPGHGVEPTLRGLGLVASARLVAPGVVVAELAASTGLALFPGSVVPRLAVGVLALGFAAAGALALRKRLNIACNCFGAGGDRKLGREQLVLVPIWLAACVAAQISPPDWSAESGVVGVALFLVVLIFAEIVMAIPVWRSLRRDRQAFG